MAPVPKVKVRVIPQFPSNVIAGDLAEVKKVGGNYSIRFDASRIQTAGQPPNTQTYSISYDAINDVYYLLPYSIFVSSEIGNATGETLTLSGPVTAQSFTGLLTNATGLPISTGVSGLATGIAAFLAAPTAGNLQTMMPIDHTGSNLLVFSDHPNITGPNITSPTGIVKADVGLGSVDNTSDATKNAAAVSLTNKNLTSGTNTFPTFNQNTTGSAASFTGSLAGDVTGGQGSTTVGKINGTSLAGLATGILKNTTGTGAPSIAVAGTDYQAPIAPQALTRTNDTNVTLTLGGTPSTALLQATSLTLGWTGALAEGRGGTNQTTYTLGDTLYSGAANTLAKLSGNITTTRQFLRQVGNGSVSAAPAWDTVTKTDVGLSNVPNTDATNASNLSSGTVPAARMPALTGDITTSAGSLATSITNNAVSNAKLAQAAAYTLKGNATGSTANMSDIDVTALTAKASPGTSDIVLIQDVSASNAYKRTTVGAISAAAASGVSSLNGQTGAQQLYVPPQGRLTLQTLTPVMTTTQSAKTTIYYTPYVGDMVPLYNGSNMVPTAVAEISIATTDTAKNPAAIGVSKVNDWFVWNDSGTLRLSHGPDWTSDTTRSAGTALVLQNGIWLNNASITNGPAASRGTYVGTTRSNSSSQIDWIYGAIGQAAALGVWNAYNRVPISTTTSDASFNWSYTSATIRQAHAASANQISFVSGLAEEIIAIDLSTQANMPTTASGFCQMGFALDSTTTFDVYRDPVGIAASTICMPAGPIKSYVPQLGFHYVSQNEAGDGTNATTFFGNAKSSFRYTARM